MVDCADRKAEFAFGGNLKLQYGVLFFGVTETPARARAIWLRRSPSSFQRQNITTEAGRSNGAKSNHSRKEEQAATAGQGQASQTNKSIPSSANNDDDKKMGCTSSTEVSRKGRRRCFHAKDRAESLCFSRSGWTGQTVSWSSMGARLAKARSSYSCGAFHSVILFCTLGAHALRPSLVERCCGSSCKATC